MNSATSDATGKSPFEMVLSFLPIVSPISTVSSDVPAVDDLVETRTKRHESAALLVADREEHINEGRDLLAAAKVRQAQQSNAHRRAEPDWKIGDLVMIDTKDRHARFKTGGARRSAKLLPRYDGPYEILKAFPLQSKYTLRLSPGDKSFPTFHTEKLKLYVPNDTALFPTREPDRPTPVVQGGEEEYEIDRIVDKKGSKGRQKYLVAWKGYPASDNSWVRRKELEETEALELWEKKEGGDRV